MDYFKCFWLENSQEKVTNMTEKSWLRRKFDRKVMTPLELWPKNLWPRWNFDRINFDPVSDYSEKKSWPRMWSARPHILINIGQPSHPINASISMFSSQAISGTVGCTSRYACYSVILATPSQNWPNQPSNHKPTSPNVDSLITNLSLYDDLGLHIL